jgi:small ligand-binding sensory domain FIST
MGHFLTGHATHPDWRMALALAAAQIDAQSARAAADAAPARLGLVYFSDHYAPHAEALLDALRQRWPALAWAGCAGVGVAASGVEYFDEPALVLMLCSLPPGRFEVFSGARPLSRIQAHTALVHADPATPDLAELIGEMSDRTATGYLFGGVVSSRTVPAQIADGVWRGGLSGVAFSADVALVSRVTQGCQPAGPVRIVTAAQRNVVLELDGKPALDCLVADIGIALENPRLALPKLRATLVGLSDANEPLVGRGAQFGSDTRVRHLVGLDPGRKAVAVADTVEPGMRLAFCTRDVDAARRDLVRICSEIREELSPDVDASPVQEPLSRNGALASRAPATGAPGATPRTRSRTIDGAVYVSCTGRGGPHFGGPSAELKIIEHALGDVPLVGFFAAGEIARHHLFGYTGVLTVFTSS